MRNLVVLFIGMSVLAQSFAQDLGMIADNVIERELDDFNKIKIMGNFKVTMIKSDVNKIHIYNNDVSTQDLEFITEVDKKGVMEVKIAKDKGGAASDSMDVKIYYKDIVAVDARRGSWINFQDPVETDSLTLEVAAGGHIIMNDLKCRAMYCATSKGGSIRLRGSCTTAHYNLFAGGEIYAFKVDSEDIWAKIRTGGQLSVTGKNILDCTIFSGGTLMYKGEPKKENLVKKIAGEFRKIRS